MILLFANPDDNLLDSGLRLIFAGTEVEVSLYIIRSKIGSWYLVYAGIFGALSGEIRGGGDLIEENRFNLRHFEKVIYF